jgi:hypothetical protein
MCVAVVCLSAASSSASAAAPVVLTFSPSVQEQDFTVPDGVTSIHILARGGSGGAGFKGGSTAGAGGGGSQITGTAAVYPGEQLGVDVAFGGSSATAPSDSGCAAGDSPSFSQGGGFGASPILDGGGGGMGDLCLGGGGGAGGGLTSVFELRDPGSTGVEIVDAGGGGGGGGGGGIAGYGGGEGGSSGFADIYFPGEDGSGPGHGSGGATAQGSVTPGTDAAANSSAGGGGGGGAGTFAIGNGESGAGGTGGGGGAGGGGGGGAGLSYVDSSVSHVSISSVPGSSGMNGTVVFTYTPPTSTLTPPVAPQLHLAMAGPRGVKPGHTATYRIALSRTQPHHRQAYPVKNVRVLSSHAGQRLARWRVRTLPSGRSRTLQLKLHVPSTAHGSYCITTRATARHTHPAAVRHCIAVETAPPPGRG